MERPSHTIAALSLQTGARRAGGVGFAVIAQLAFLAVLVGGIVDRVIVSTPPPLEVTDVQKIKPVVPPPPIKVARAAMPMADKPFIEIAPGGKDDGIHPEPRNEPQPPVTPRQPPQVTVPDRPAVAIADTHTAPPYPSLARRLGVEGKVTLRLTVLPDGSVARADVVTSSGRQDLDQAAQQWITAHWTYRPAIRNGAPAGAQLLAAVQFSLMGNP